jgi:Putative cyclase
MTTLPSYDELPVRAGLPSGSSWGVWGDGDVFGCLNLLTPDRVLAGAACVRDGAVFPLNLELELPGPPLFGRPSFTHEVSWLGGDAKIGHDDQLHGWNTQSSSQWDGFRHIRHPVHGFYNGIADEDHGIHHWARRGIAGRAVLCDVDAYRADDGRPIDHATNDAITPDDVSGALAAQGVEIETGDILLLHTGWVDWYRSLDAAGRAALAAGTRLSAPGLLPGVGTARFLWNLHIAAIGADNPAVEVFPPASVLAPEDAAKVAANPGALAEDALFVHFSLLPLLGLPLGELWDLGPLTAACRADDRWTGLLVSSPLNLASGVASPPNVSVLR